MKSIAGQNRNFAAENRRRILQRSQRTRDLRHRHRPRRRRSRRGQVRQLASRRESPRRQERRRGASRPGRAGKRVRSETVFGRRDHLPDGQELKRRLALNS